MGKSKERAPEIINNSHVIGLFSGLAELTICAVTIYIISSAQLSECFPTSHINEGLHKCHGVNLAKAPIWLAVFCQAILLSTSMLTGFLLDFASASEVRIELACT